MKRCRILIAEDNPDQIELIRARLKDAPFEVNIANTGELALSLIHVAQVTNNQYDLVISDIAMPFKTGITVLEEMRESGDNTPFIIVSALPEREVKDLVDGHDVYKVLSKPEAYINIVPIIMELMDSLDCEKEEEKTDDNSQAH